MYKPRFLKSFLKQEKILPKDLKERVIRITKEILEDPHSGVMLKGDWRGYWRKRIGKLKVGGDMNGNRISIEAFRRAVQVFW